MSSPAACTCTCPAAAARATQRQPGAAHNLGIRPVQQPALTRCADRTAGATDANVLPAMGL